MDQEQHVLKSVGYQSLAARFIILALMAVCAAPTTAASHSLVGSWTCTFSQSPGMPIPAGFVFKADGSETWHLDALPVEVGIGTYDYDGTILTEHMRRGFGDVGRGSKGPTSDSMHLLWKSANHFRMRTPSGRAESSLDVVNGIYDCKRH